MKRLISLGKVLVVAVLLAAGAPLRAQETVQALEARAEEQIKGGEIFAAIETLEALLEKAPDRVDLRLRLANLQKKRSLWLRAAEHYRKVLEDDPSNVEARLGYAELLLADYQFGPAQENFRLLLGQELKHEDEDRARIGLGTALYGMAEYAEAVEAYRPVLEDHPDGHPTARAYTNFALRNLGDLDGAIRGWQILLEHRPDLSRGEILLGELQELKADILHQQELVKEKPEDAEAHRRLGDLLTAKPDISGAIRAYSKAAELDPDNTAVRMQLGLAMRQGGYLPAASDIFRSLVRDPEVGSLASYNLAWCERRLAGPAAEAAAWRVAVEHNPTDAHAYRRYLDAVSRSDQLQRELGLLLAAIKERTTDPLPRTQYGVLSVAMSRPEEAALAFLDALSLEPNDPWAQRELRRIFRLQPDLSAKVMATVKAASNGGEPSRVDIYRRASIHLAAGEPDRCIEVLEPLAARQDGDPRGAVALAGCLRASGSTADRVLAILREARDAAPDYFYARLDLAMALSVLGRYREAATEAAGALQLDPDNVYALTALGVSLNEIGGSANLRRAEEALRLSLLASPMDPTGVARLLLAKVEWKLGKELNARRVLHGDVPVEPDELYHLAWEFVRDNYRDRTYNGQDWNGWRDRFAGTLENEQEALGAIALMLASLDDRDTRLRSSNQTEAHMFTRRGRTVDRDPTGRATASSRTVKSETLEDNVGYVAVTNMHDPKLSEDVKEVFEEMKQRDAVILDLRGNLGGSERDAEVIEEILVEPGTPTGSVLTAEGEVPKVTKSTDPPKVTDKPVVVLVDRNTASSAEALAGALKESKRAVIVGENTYGKAGIQMPRLLPGGTMLLLATAESADLAGVSYSGRGVDPDVMVDDGRVGRGERDDEALVKAREILRKKRMEARTKSSGDKERP